MRSIYRVLSTGVAYNGVNSITGVSQWVHRVTIHNHANIYHKHELHPMFTQVTCQQKIHCYITPSQQVCVLTHKLHQIHILAPFVVGILDDCESPGQFEYIASSPSSIWGPWYGFNLSKCTTFLCQAVQTSEIDTKAD